MNSKHCQTSTESAQPMAMSRKKLTRDERHATALLMIKRGDGRYVIDREESRLMTALEIIEIFASRTHVEHIVPHALTGNDHPSNVQFMMPDEHATKTRIDVREIARTKRIETAHAAFRSKVLAKTSGDVIEPSRQQKQKIPSRPFQKLPVGMKRDWKTGRQTKEKSE